MKKYFCCLIIAAAVLKSLRALPTDDLLNTLYDFGEVRLFTCILTVFPLRVRLIRLRCNTARIPAANSNQNLHYWIGYVDGSCTRPSRGLLVKGAFLQPWCLFTMPLCIHPLFIPATAQQLEYILSQGFPSRVPVVTASSNYAASRPLAAAFDFVYSVQALPAHFQLELARRVQESRVSTGTSTMDGTPLYDVEVSVCANRPLQALV